MSLFDTKDESELYSMEEIQNNKAVCIIGYFGFFFFIPLVAAPNSGYAKFHANQGLLLFILEALFSVVAAICRACEVMPMLGRMFSLTAAIVTAIGGVVTLILFIIGIVNVTQGRAKELPIIGGIRIIK